MDSVVKAYVATPLSNIIAGGIQTHGNKYIDTRPAKVSHGRDARNRRSPSRLDARLNKAARQPPRAGLPSGRGVAYCDRAKVRLRSGQCRYHDRYVRDSRHARRIHRGTSSADERLALEKERK